jgi:hypothetical protein
MPFTVLQGGTSLQIMDTAGTLTTLTLPTGVVIDSSKRMRAAVSGRYVVIVNSPTRPISIDPEGVVRVLCPRTPRTRITLSGVTTGALSGTYLAKQSFRVLDVDGNVIAETPLGPTTTAVTISTKLLRASDLDISDDTISGSRIYRTTTNGSVYLPWIDLDGNTQTSIEDDLSDALLTTLAAPTLGEPPNELTIIADYKSRLWGVASTDIDTIRFTDVSRMYSWPASFGLIVGRPGSDARGITGIIPRKNELAVGRFDSLYQIAGQLPSDFAAIKIKDGIGIASHDSVRVHRDVAYWLGRDGVYSWSDEGVQSISDGRVRSWFNTDTTFNRGRFEFAIGRIDPLLNKYQLLLSAAGSSDLDRWVEFDIDDRTWWGPHKTSDFTPTWAAQILDANGLIIPVFGSSSGFLYKDQATRTDGTATAIDFDVDTKFHDMNTPVIEKYFDQLTLLSKIQGAGTLTVTPKVGGLNASASAAISVDMTRGKEDTRRLGQGRFCQLNFRHNTAGQDVELYGYELPWHELGDR